tara:strand:+ start:1344 stop:1871 length:528 start_codon:yes stop_codon:yes gene_type:complete
MLDKLCPPALLYVAFSITQIIIDIFKNMYNTAFFKFIVMVIFTFALNILCQNGLGVISWFIVFVPFVMMTIITTLMLIVFGLSPTTGKLKYNIDYPESSSIIKSSNASSKSKNNDLQKPKKINKNDIKQKKDDPLPHIQTILKSKNTVISPEENTDDKTQTLSNNTETKLKTKTV